jgi:excisionase family DNA binding protein
MTLAGMSKDQIEKAMIGKERGELVNIIYMLASFEPMFSPQEVAKRRQLSKRVILKLVKEGRLRAHKPLATTIRIPASAIREWDENTKV